MFDSTLRAAAVRRSATTANGPKNRSQCYAAYGAPRSAKIAERHVQVVTILQDQIEAMLNDGFSHGQIADVLTDAAADAGMAGYKISGKTFSRVYRSIHGVPAGARSAGAVRMHEAREEAAVEPEEKAELAEEVTKVTPPPAIGLDAFDDSDELPEGSADFFGT